MRIHYAFFALMFVLMIGIGSAELKSLPNPIKIDEPVVLSQVCDNCTYVNVTTLKYPNSSISNLNVVMTKNNGDYSYVLSSSFNSMTGEYVYTTCGNPDSVYTCQAITYLVNPLGKTFTNSQALLYMLIFFVAVIIFIGTLVFGIYLPSGNDRDEMTGYILAVSNLKYLKMFSLAVSYLSMMLIFYFGWMISYGYLDLDVLGKLFYAGFVLLLTALLPLFAISLFVVIANKVRDSKIAEQLQRGLRVK